MLPFARLINLKTKPKPNEGEIVFRLGNLDTQTGIVDSGPHKIPITNLGNLQILSDQHGTYIDFPRGVNKFLSFSPTGIFNIAECTVRIVCSSSVISNGDSNLNGLVANAMSYSVGIGSTGSPPQVTIRGEGDYPFKVPIVVGKQDLLDITVVHKITGQRGCYMDVVGYPRVSSSYTAEARPTLPVYIGGLPPPYTGDSYQIKGKIYLIEIRLPV